MDQFFASRVVFYPGSGTDGQPVEYFGIRHAAHCFIFVDYGITQNHLLQELGDSGHPFEGYECAGRCDINVRDLALKRWPHVQPDGALRGPDAPGEAYAFIEILERRPAFNDSHGPKRLAILFLCADGVEAYDALFCQTKAAVPFAVVLQDHGFSGNWTRFGRGGDLDRVATHTGQFPEFLLVADNTEPWAGYSAIAGTIASGGGMHGHHRQLWRRISAEVL